MKCPNFERCGAELTEMETGCKRCLVCNPMTKYVIPKKKERRDIDLPWTDERVIEVIDRVVPDMIAEAIRNHAQSQMVITDNMDTVIADSLATATLEVPDVLVDGKKQLTWREQAKELGIILYHKTKENVLMEIAEKQKGKQNGKSQSEEKKKD